MSRQRQGLSYSRLHASSRRRIGSPGSQPPSGGVRPSGRRGLKHADEEDFVASLRSRLGYELSDIIQPKPRRKKKLSAE